MCEAQYDPNCEGCKISQTPDNVSPEKLVIGLDGDWTLNQYGGKEGFLGWLALQPRYHRTDLKKLTGGEARALGRNIKDIDFALREYWKSKFPHDPIKRVYVVYFCEGYLDVPKPARYHLHIHLIPRTRRIGKLLREYTQPGSDEPPCRSTIRAWSIYKVTKCLKFPDEYRPYNLEPQQDLMEYLHKQLDEGPHSM